MTRLLILGGGVAGLDLASRLGGRVPGLEVGLVDREPAHVWKPLLHTIAAGTSDAVVQQTSYVAQAAEKGFRFHPGEVIAIDRRARLVHLGPVRLDGQEVLPGRALRYDVVLLALGSRANDFGTPGVSDHCFAIDGRSDAIALNDRIRARLIKAAASGSTTTVGIVGGGATGVELAAELVQFATTIQSLGLPGTRGAMRVVLLNSDERLLSAFPPRVAEAALRKLEELGVEVLSGVKVVEADDSGFSLEGGGRIVADVRVWAAGVRAPAVLDTLDGLERTRGGQLVVGPDLVCPGDRSIIGIGDCASPRLQDRDTPVPATAQAAFQEAVYLARHLPGILAGRAVPPFRYHDFGSLVSLGGFDAYGTLGRFGFFEGGFIRGRVAQLGHAMLYRRHQARIHGVRRGSLLWLADAIANSTRLMARLA